MEIFLQNTVDEVPNKFTTSVVHADVVCWCSGRPWPDVVQLCIDMARGGLARVAKWRSPPGPHYNLGNRHPFKAWPRSTGPFRVITPPQNKSASPPLPVTETNNTVLAWFVCPIRPMNRARLWRCLLRETGSSNLLTHSSKQCSITFTKRQHGWKLQKHLPSLKEDYCLQKKLKRKAWPSPKRYR